MSALPGPEAVAGSADNVDRAAVGAMNAAFYQAVEKADLDAMSELWDDVEPDDLTCAHPGWPPLRGRRQVLRSWAAVMAASGSLQFLLTDLHVALAGDTAVVTCTENVVTALPGGAGEAGAASALNVFRRRPAGWRLTAHHAGALLQNDNGSGDA